MSADDPVRQGVIKSHVMDLAPGNTPTLAPYALSFRIILLIFEAYMN